MDEKLLWPHVIFKELQVSSTIKKHDTEDYAILYYQKQGYFACKSKNFDKEYLKKDQIYDEIQQLFLEKINGKRKNTSHLPLGFPDLILIKDNQIEFCEVKLIDGGISFGQLEWIKKHSEYKIIILQFRFLEKQQSQIENASLQSKENSDLQNEIYFTKRVKMWGGSLIIKISPDEIKILNLEKGDTIEGRLSIKKKVQKLSSSQRSEKEEKMQEQEFEGAHLQDNEEFDEDEEDEEEDEDGRE